MDKKSIHSGQTVFEELFRKYYKILRAYAFRQVGDRGIAEDIVQDVYFELWRNHKNLDLDLMIKSYLFRAVYTRSLNYLQSKGYIAQESLERTTDEKIQQTYIQSHLWEQERELFTKELQQTVSTAINSLPDKCRKVFILSRKNELKNREIAELLGISVKAVEKHISKALSALRIQLKDVELLLLLLSYFFVR